MARSNLALFRQRTASTLFTAKVSQNCLHACPLIGGGEQHYLLRQLNQAELAETPFGRSLRLRQSADGGWRIDCPRSKTPGLAAKANLFFFSGGARICRLSSNFGLIDGKGVTPIPNSHSPIPSL